MSKVALLVLSMALIASLALSCSDEPELVRFAADGDYFPYNFLDDAGEVDGFEADLIDEVYRRANLECTWVITPWDGIIDSLIAKEFDMITAGMSINEERDRVIDFTQSYLPPHAIRLYRPGRRWRRRCQRQSGCSGEHSSCRLSVRIRLNAPRIQVG